MTSIADPALRKTSSPSAHAIAPARMGLIAGWGDFPIVVAERLRDAGCEVVCLGITGHADPILRTICHEFAEIGPAKVGGQIRWFRKRGVRRATMAGKVFKTVLFERGYLWRQLPDWRCIRALYPHFITMTRDRKDDSLLTAFCDAYAQDGIDFVPATDMVPELLAPAGVLTKRSPTASETRDIAFGWTLAKAIGAHDIGQSVAVKGRAVLAVEAVEGTDACITRAGTLCPAGGFAVVKTAKPQQDMRFDVPTVGLGTLENLVAAGGKVLAIEAGRTIVLDLPAVQRYADQHGLTIVSQNVSE